MSDPTTGQRSLCQSCGAPIEFAGEHWRHLGAVQPRHIARPVEAPAPVAPASWPRTHVTWAITHNDACPGCGGPLVLVIAPDYWRIDEEDRSDGDPDVDVGEEVTGHYCRASRRLVSLALNA